MRNYVSMDCLMNLQYTTLVISVVNLLLLIGIWLPLHSLNTLKHSKHFHAGIQTLHTMRSDHFSDTCRNHSTSNNYTHIVCSLDPFMGILCTESLSSFIKLLKYCNPQVVAVCGLSRDGKCKVLPE